MLRALNVRGLAVIERLELEFQPGLSVFSGETGAGKSILVGAIGLALGARGGKELIRQNAERAEITLECELPAEGGVRGWLAQHEFEADSEILLLRRVLTRSSSRATINDSPASISTLRDAAQQIIEIHGQHEHQRLLQRGHQRVLLDGACEHADALQKLATCQRTLIEVQTQAQRIGVDREQHRQALSLLEFQVQELEALGLTEGDYEEMDIQQKRLSSADELRMLCSELLDSLYDREQDSTHSRLADAASKFEQAAQFDPRLQDATDFLPNALNQVEEAVHRLRHGLGSISLDPEALAEVEQRLAATHEMARKHQVRPQELWAHAKALREKLTLWQSPQYDADALEAEVQRLRDDYRAQADGISKTRQRVAKQIASHTTDILQQLGMPHAEFVIAVQADPEREPAAHGIDEIEFRIRTNPDQEPGPINAVASGGELSRLSLALQQALSGGDETPVMIFDEVDAGIGGGPAEIVGQLLARLGAQTQVLCVTHLPQVAVQAQHHYCVRKHDTGRTEVAMLDDSGRVEELTRMFSGVEKTETARSHAQALLQQVHGAAHERVSA